MGRRAKGHVREVGGKFLAELRGEHLGSFNTHNEAVRRVKAEINLDAGKAIDSLRLVGEEWMKQREESGDVRGFASERSVWAQHVATAPFYDWPLKKTRTPDVSAWLIALSKKRKLITARTTDKEALKPGEKAAVRRGETTLSRQTVLHARRLLRSCYAAAVAAGKAVANPVSEAKMPKMEGVADEEDDEWSFLFAEEITLLFTAIEMIVPLDTSKLKPKTLARLEQRRAFYRAVYAIAIYGGLRQGEIFGLHWEDIHFEQRGRGDRVNCIRVRRTRNMGRSPKTKSSKRSVPMLSPLRAALDRWRRHGGVVKTHGKVFPADGAAGQGNTPKTLGGYFGQSYDAAWEARWRRESGSRDYVTFHDLRHTCGSHLVMGTFGKALTALEVAAWLGHSDLKTTMRYMHLAPGSLNDLVRQMETASSGIGDVVRRMELGRQTSEHGR
jgi:integrase